MSEMNDSNINFHKLIKGLSTSALKYLINVAKQETVRRSKTRTFPTFENKALPKLEFDSKTIITIRDVKWKITSFTYYKMLENDIACYVSKVQDNENIVIDVEKYDWEKMMEIDKPLSITLTMLEYPNVHQNIEMHSRSKIFWFYKLLENKEEVKI